VAINYAGNSAAADETVRLCREAAGGTGQSFQTFQGDIASSASRQAMLAAIASEMGPIDGLVNNAGIAPRVRADITETGEESFDEVLETNLKGPFFLTQAVVHQWLSGQESKLASGFKIVFVTSVSANTASTSRGEYCISKAGLAMAVQLWASRLAGEGVQVYEVRPGIMKTDMTRPVEDKYDEPIKDGLVPQRRWGTAEDVGLAVAALVDGQFPYSTGTVIDVDGGLQMRTL
jgi:NAD(P)-dependent dehydrogenase (short-subunit alcohol dehydrogenase family)